MRILDRLTVAVAIFLIALLLVFRFFMIPAFDAMLSDLGTEPTWLTQVVIGGWPPLVFATAAAACVGMGLRPGATRGRRRVYALGAVAVAGGGLGVCLVAMYVPIFHIANAVG